MVTQKAAGLSTVIQKSPDSWTVESIWAQILIQPLATLSFFWGNYMYLAGQLWLKTLEAIHDPHSRLPNMTYCWWFRNPANHLRLVVYPIIYRVLYISGGCLGFLPSTVPPSFVWCFLHQVAACTSTKFCRLWLRSTMRAVAMVHWRPIRAWRGNSSCWPRVVSLGAPEAPPPPWKKKGC